MRKSRKGEPGATKRKADRAAFVIDEEFRVWALVMFPVMRFANVGRNRGDCCILLETEGQNGNPGGIGAFRGAPDFLTRTEFVIAEGNVINRYPGSYFFACSYSFAEFIAPFHPARFPVAELCDIARTPSAEFKSMDLALRGKAA